MATTHSNHKSLLLVLTQTLFVLVPLVLASPSKAFGYADPGTGAFVYQAAYAIFLGGSFYLRRLLDRVFRKRR
jgi:hypothetical protein